MVHPWNFKSFKSFFGLQNIMKEPYFKRLSCKLKAAQVILHQIYINCQGRKMIYSRISRIIKGYNEAYLPIRDASNFMTSLLYIFLDSRYYDYIVSIFWYGYPCSSVGLQLFQVIATFAKDELVMLAGNWQFTSHLQL